MAKFKKTEEMRGWFESRMPGYCQALRKVCVGHLFGPDWVQCSRFPVKGEKFCWQHKRNTAK